MPTTLIRNERIKLIAGALNNVGIATIVTAIVVPSVSFVYNPTWPPVSHWWPVVGAFWLTAGGALHSLALLILGRLTP